MAEANVATGFQVHPGLYRVPDLLSEENFRQYMWDNYRVRLTFEHVEASINVPEVEDPPLDPEDEDDEELEDEESEDDSQGSSFGS